MFAKKEKENKYIEELKNTITQLEKENIELKEKLDSTSTKSFQAHIEELNKEIAKVSELKIKLQELLKKENELYDQQLNKYKKATNKAIKDFKKDLIK